MRLIVITPETPVRAEAEAIMTMLDLGVERVHLRHPRLSAETIAGIIGRIDRHYRGRLSLNDCHPLALRYGCGIHLNSRNPSTPEDFKGIVSRSCHSIAEVVAAAPITDYRFISPVFDSISKQGYTTIFTPDELRGAFDDGRLDSDTFALGGVSADTIGRLRDTGFSGVAALGAAWGSGGIENITQHIKRLLQCCNS